MKEEYKKALKFDIIEFTNPLLKYNMEWVKELHRELNGQHESVEKYANVVYRSRKIFTCGKEGQEWEAFTVE